MHFSVAAALLAFSSISVTYAAPVANSENDIVRRTADYQVVNVDGEEPSSAAPEVQTVTATIKSEATVAGATAEVLTVTVTATPSSTPISSAVPSGPPRSHVPPPPGGSFFPNPDSKSFFRRGLRAAGDPLQFARSYTPSPSGPGPVSATPLAARNFEGWYSSPIVTPSASAAPSIPLVARQFGSQSLATVLPSSASSIPAGFSIPMVARGFYDASSIATPSATASPSASLIARQFGNRKPGAELPSSPSSSFAGSPTPVIARDFYEASSSAPYPSLSSPAGPTPLVARQFGNQYQPGASGSTTPSASFSPSPSVSSIPY
ncbi:hypothetical protein N7462_006448 [Penicillium macrosclerotiorum]|uniref:uncharacterized protein n=1 Tax=Penicillium macrosclerotiorum TaxID=303699 RepID=UPI0025495D49|nr:uncharacterized protein N7462_006448 [Penicillium macrosclerotiorum]KAJ5683283.1 hypothetical protein N7462_006448 [Penicillium macrosclerotiorum]